LFDLLIEIANIGFNRGLGISNLFGDYLQTQDQVLLPDFRVSVRLMSQNIDYIVHINF
jgi:hypothetical protein